MSLVLKSGPRFSADSPSPEQGEGRGGEERGGEGRERRVPVSLSAYPALTLAGQWLCLGVSGHQTAFAKPGKCFSKPVIWYQPGKGKL